MSEKKILVIDDSATIRRLVDSYLSPAGYRVVLAATAEEGLKQATEIQPDLILLDHQLPGTTGYDVCTQLVASDQTRQTPVVISSTLRKKAYVEYADLPNVVDMLPKPYTSDLLQTTVANALDTGKLVVESQQQGTAVPEVIQELGEPELSGTFTHFRLREILDFLNNGTKCGILEVESEYQRTFFFIDRSRITGVTASGVEVSRLVERLPESLQSLAPVMNLTLGGRSSTELDGIVELLDRKVLDPRLLRKLLRHQAAALTFDCFASELRQFRFQATKTVPPLQRKLPLDTSLLALLIDGALECPADNLPAIPEEGRFARRMMRGQNLDRAGVSAQHMKVLGLLSEPRSLAELVQTLKWDEDEVRRVLFGMMLVDAIELQVGAGSRHVLAFDANATTAHRLREFLAGGSQNYTGKVVRDRLALQLVLKRSRPAAIVFNVDPPEHGELCRELFASGAEALSQTKWVAIIPPGDHADAQAFWTSELQVPFSAVLPHSWTVAQLEASLDQAFDHNGDSSPSSPASEVSTSESTDGESSRSDQHDGSCYAVEA